MMEIESPLCIDYAISNFQPLEPRASPIQQRAGMFIVVAPLGYIQVKNIVYSLCRLSQRSSTRTVLSEPKGRIV